MFAFSTENWKRPKNEINYLFNLLEDFLLNKIEDINKQNIKLKKAEHAYLSRPERLQSIAEQKLNMKEILPTDIWNINDISKLYFEKY